MENTSYHLIATKIGKVFFEGGRFKNWSDWVGGTKKSVFTVVFNRESDDVARFCIILR